MGKSKCRKSRNRRSRPTGIPSLKELQEEDEVSSDNKNEADAVDEILAKLLSNSSEDKLCSAAFITQSANNSSFVNSLIERNVVKIAAPFIVDKNLSVGHDMAACLRALSVCGGPRVANAMVEQDVMTAVTTFLKESLSSDPSKLLEENHSVKKHTFIEVCGLVTSLCENSSMALEIFNKNELLPVMLPYLKTPNENIRLSIVHCLQTVTENNVCALKLVAEYRHLEAIHAILSTAPVSPVLVHIRALTAGVLFNLNSSKVGTCETSAGTDLIKVIEETLDIPLQQETEKLSHQFLSLKITDGAACQVCHSLRKSSVRSGFRPISGFISDTSSNTYRYGSHRKESKEKRVEPDVLQKQKTETAEMLRNLNHVLEAKQVALEILTNICTSDDSADMDEDDSSSGLSDGPIDDDDDGFCSGPAYSTPIFSLEVTSMIVKRKLIKKLPQQIVILNEALMENLRKSPEGQEVLKRFQTVRCRALFCANNVIQALDVDDLGGPTELFQLWVDLSTLMFTRTDAADQEQMEAASSSVRAVLQKLAEAEGVSSQFGQMADSDLRLFFDIYHKSSDAGVRVNIVRCVATIGCILGNMTQQNSYSFVQVTGAFLLEVCMKSSELWVTAEALDALFDVFAEDHLDSIAQEIGLVEKFSTLVPLLKGKIKQQKNSLGEHLPVIMTAKTNLLRFLRYKNKLM